MTLLQEATDPMARTPGGHEQLDTCRWEAEAQGFDMILSMMKYRGFGGDTGYWDACLETFTLMAALAAVTSRVELFPSVTLPALHPAVVARMVSTIDDISGGRCGLNIVT